LGFVFVAAEVRASRLTVVRLPSWLTAVLLLVARALAVFNS
jgi:hypothetical protein